MNFKYTAYTPQQKIIKGVLEVADKKIAIESLERAGYNILSLKSYRKINIEDVLPSLFSVKKSDIVLFSRQLAMLLEKGIKFLAALELSKDQVHNRILKKRLKTILEDVEGGSTFSDALSKHPDVFPVTYSHMIKVGEKAGKLEVVLREEAEHIEQEELIRKKIRSAFIYPSVIFVMGIGTVIILLTTVLPSMMDLFSQFGSELPLPTRITVSLAEFFDNYAMYLILGILIFTLLIMTYSRTISGKYNLERILLCLPVVGRIISLRNLEQFSRISSILLSAGLPVPEVILIARQGVQSETVRHELAKIPESLIQGQGLSGSMKKSALFPSMLIQMITTGEETNTLESSFEALAEHYAYEFNQSLNTFISLLEPVLILVIGLIIGFIAISAMMPIYSIYDVMA
ncbi:MAG: type II secretion system F family protein [Dehalococcoidales bacterium]|nr:MAG: type II secretion system F family protein [Dehalococcoidales bacterium]